MSPPIFFYIYSWFKFFNLKSDLIIVQITHGAKMSCRICADMDTALRTWMALSTFLGAKMHPVCTL